MSRASVPCLAVLSIAMTLGTTASHADESPGLRIEARVTGSERDPTTIVIEFDGRAHVGLTPRLPERPSVALEFTLTLPEMDEARRLVTEARFFETWEEAPLVDDGTTFDVTIRLGERPPLSRRAHEQPEFEPLAKFLERFVLQATVTARLRAGDSWSVGSVAPFGRGADVIRPLALVPEFIACAAAIQKPFDVAEAARLLLGLPADLFVTSARSLLERLDGERRGSVLAKWAAELERPDRAAQRRAFTATALAEVEASWARWPRMTGLERAGVDGPLAMLLRDRVPRAFEVAEEMVVALATVERCFVPSGLLDTGAAAVPSVVRLLEAEAPAPRVSGASLARFLADDVRDPRRAHRRFADAERQALEARLRDEVVPVLERCTQDERQPYSVRKACWEALEAWDGRVKAAVTRAQTATDAARAREEGERARAALPPLEGTQTISGRLLGPSDTPLPGFTVLAVRDDGRCRRSAITSDDGSFRVERLAAGTYRIGWAHPGEHLMTRGPFDVEGVEAGAEHVVVRPPGTMVRGRLLDAAGKPAAGRRVVAQLRDAPSEQGPAFGGAVATTDVEGRFWLLRLLPGVYDLELPGSDATRGATGVVAGLDERTVETLTGESISGRVVDETGAPLSGLWVSVARPSATWQALQTASSSGDGAFRFDGLDPSRRYVVWTSLVGDDPRAAKAEDVATGTKGVVLRVDTTPRLRLEVVFRGHDGPSTPVSIGLRRIAGGPSTERTFRGNRVDWPAALSGTWTVSAQVRDLDAEGVTAYAWIEVGTVTTGDPPRRFDVER